MAVLPGRRTLLMGLLLAAACTAPPARPLRIGLNPFPGYAGFYVASAHGVRRGQPVQLIRFNSASEVIRALRAGQIEGAALTADEALLAAHESPGGPLGVVAVLDFSQGADVILARPPVRRFTDLRGRRIGLESSALGGYMLARALELHHLRPADVEAVHLSLDEHEQRYRDGTVDAIVTFGPARTRLLAEGAVPVFDSRAIPGEIVDLLVIRPDLGEAQRAAVRELLAGWFGALALVRNHADSAAGLLRQSVGYSATEIRDEVARLDLPDLARNRALLTPGPDGLEPTLARLTAALRAHGLVPDPPAAGLRLDPGLLPDAP